MIRIACCADIHLDDKATAAGRIVLGSDGRNIRGVDRERCFQAFVDGAIEHDCHLALIAGDLFERPKPTPSEYCAAEQALDDLCAVMPVVLVGDNHGLPQSPLEQHAIAPLAGRHEDLHVKVRPGVSCLRTKTSPVMIAALPWPQRSLLAAKEETAGLGPGAVNALISDNLAAIVRSFPALRQPKIPLILLAHVMLREAVFDNGQGPDTGAITLSAEDLVGFDLAVLGDIHRAQAFGPEGRIFYPGSLDRTDFGEEHQEKSWTCVELEPGHPLGFAEFPTPARSYFTLGPEDLSDDVIRSAETRGQDLERSPIYRLKGQVSQENYDALGQLLARLRSIPTFSEQLEVARQTRARSEAMTSDLTPEAALRTWAEAQGKVADLPALLAAHRELAGAGT